MHPPTIILHHHQQWCLWHNIFFSCKPKASYITYPSYTKLSCTTLFWNSLYMVCHGHGPQPAAKDMIKTATRCVIKKSIFTQPASRKPSEGKICFCLELFQRGGGGGAAPNKKFLGIFFFFFFF